MTNFRGFVLEGATIEHTSLAMGLFFTGIYTVALAAAGYLVFAKRDI